jgi:MFS family permease
MLVPYAGCETNYVMSILILGNFFLGFNAGGDVPVAGEITTNFPATLYAIGNMFGCSTGFLAPYVVGVILESGSETEDLLFLWSKVFYISASIGIFGALIFISFGDATKQAWDNIPDDVEFCLSDQDNIHEDDDNQNLRDNNSRVRMSFQTQNRKSPYMSCN